MTKRLDYNLVKNIFEDRDCLLLSTEYKNNHTKLDYICNRDHKHSIRFNHFRQGHGCPTCRSLNMIGNKNPFYGKKHTVETIRKQSIVKMGKNNPMFGKNFSEEHRRKLSIVNKDKNYKPELSPEHRISHRLLPGYKEWRTSVYEMDDYTCQVCSRKGYRLEAHHIEGYNSNLDLRTEVSNGITLCVGCHKDFHAVYGKGDNTLKQFEEFKLENFNRGNNNGV